LAHRKADQKYLTFRDVVPEKNGEDQLDQSCEERSITYSQGGEKYPANNTKKEG